MNPNFRDGRFILTVKNEHVMDKIQFFYNLASTQPTTKGVGANSSEVNRLSGKLTTPFYLEPKLRRTNRIMKTPL
jgi:hypothetical protein